MVENEKKDDLYDFFEEVKKRPPMYLCRVSIFDLHSCYTGYHIARRLLKLPISKQEKDFEEFTPWLQKKFGIQANRSWAIIIFFHSYDERDAITEFFELLEEFKNRG